MMTPGNRHEFFADIITGATEGGTNYWAYSRNYSWSHDDPKLTTVQFCEMEMYDDGHARWHTCNMETLETAFRILGKQDPGTVHLRAETITRYLDAFTELDAGDLDAGDADNIVQIGMFGKVIYG